MSETELNIPRNDNIFTGSGIENLPVTIENPYIIFIWRGEKIFLDIPPPDNNTLP